MEVGIGNAEGGIKKEMGAPERRRPGDGVLR